MYEEKTACEILGRLNDRGWNVYARPANCGSDGLWYYGMIREGPAKRLELNTKYVLLPKVENEKNPEEVMGRLRKFANGNEGKVSRLNIGRERVGFTGFTFEDEKVRLNTSEEVRIDYSELSSALESLDDASEIIEGQSL